MHGKDDFSKITEIICNTPIEAGNICNILPRPAIFNGFIVVKLKQDLKYTLPVFTCSKLTTGSKVHPASIYLLKINNGNTRTKCEICSKLKIEIPGRCH